MLVVVGGGASEAWETREDLPEQMTSGRVLCEKSFLALLKCGYSLYSRQGVLHVQRPCGEKEPGLYKAGLCCCPILSVGHSGRR